MIEMECANVLASGRLTKRGAKVEWSWPVAIILEFFIVLSVSECACHLKDESQK